METRKWAECGNIQRQLRGARGFASARVGFKRRLLVEGVNPRRTALPVAKGGVGVIVVVPAFAEAAAGAAQVVTFGSFDVAIAEEDVGAVVVPVGGAGGMAAGGLDIGGFAVGVEVGRDVLGNGRNVADQDHVGGVDHHAVLDGTLIQTTVDVATQ